MQYFPVQQTNVNPPVGAIVLYPNIPVRQGTKDPLEAFGWMRCDGRVIEAPVYPELYAIIGNMYNNAGVENGDFMLPNLGVQQVNNVPFVYIIKYTYGLTPFSAQ